MADEIWDYHKRHAGQPWNTIDERGMDPKDLLRKWPNPVYPMYRLSRPFKEPMDRRIAGKISYNDHNDF